MFQRDISCIWSLKIDLGLGWAKLHSRPGPDAPEWYELSCKQQKSTNNLNVDNAPKHHLEMQAKKIKNVGAF